MANLQENQQNDPAGIVCPLCLAIAIASKGQLGAIQSYRCTYRPNLNKGNGAWETRPQKKSDKWASDFFKVLNAPKGEEVILSDGETRMKGLGRDSNTRFEFTQGDGEGAYRRAIQVVKAGEVRAPRNWDRTFADVAGMSLDELKQTYPETYQSTSRGSSGQRQSGNEEEVEALGEGFFDATVGEGHSAVAAEALDEEDDNAIAEDEEGWEETDLEQEPEEEAAYSVMAELELEEPTKSRTQQISSSGDMTGLKINAPSSSQMITVHAGCLAIRADMGGEYITFYKVKNPATGRYMWLKEGENEDLSEFFLKVN